MIPADICIWWLRRDLRLFDNAALYHALISSYPVLPVFIFDRTILDPLPATDARVSFIHLHLTKIRQALLQLGSDISCWYGYPEKVWHQIINNTTNYTVRAVFANHDYEPEAIKRDETIKNLLANKGIDFFTYKDQVIFEKDEILTDSQKPYTVFTPYKNKWLKTCNAFYLKSYPTEKYFHRFYQFNTNNSNPNAIPELAAMGFKAQTIDFPPANVVNTQLETYRQTRNFPAIAGGTTRLGVHLRFGTISVRQLVRQASTVSDTFVNELIWRDFYQSILYHFPTVVSMPFKKEYSTIDWQNDISAFERWKAGQTGYPIVDAGMRELAETGYMHNRVRMITASFLTKHLLINWQWGESWFAEKLLDFELASNNGGWQWAAGCGVDAAPYFRIFNPFEQARKFDANAEYIRKWVPEVNTARYPKPIIEHTFARQRCLAYFKQAFEKSAIKKTLFD